MNCQHYCQATQTSPTKQVDFLHRERQVNSLQRETQVDLLQKEREVFFWSLVTGSEQPPTVDETLERLFGDLDKW